jgi:hypothetical protein
MNQKYLSIPEWHHVDDKIFREEVITQFQPAVLRGFVKKWPVVKHALQSPQAVCQYIKSFDNGSVVNAIMTRPEVKGRVSYQEDMNGYNFVRNSLPISAVVDQLLRYSVGQNSPSVAVQSALIPACIPGFGEENKLTALDESISPRIWMGNTFTVPAHMDDAHNIACVVSGKRRFTLFPTDQVANLYIGPLDFTIAGAPISMVSSHNPDFKRFPRYKEALSAAQVAELEPGDALYIPALWWHQVESIGKINILINYWWGGSIGTADPTQGAFDCLIHCLLNMKELQPETREAWGKIFNHYIFKAANTSFDYIPEHKRGILGKLSPEQAQQIKAGLVSKLQK